MQIIESNRNQYINMTFFISNVCNLSCDYCSYKKYVIQPDQLDPEFKFQKYCNLIDKIYKPTAVKVLGGEPLLFPYYEQLIYKLLDNPNIKKIEVFSNCTNQLKIIDDRIIYLISLHKDHYNFLNIYKRNPKEVHKLTQLNVLVEPYQELDSQIYEILEYAKTNKIYVFPLLIELPSATDDCPHQTWYNGDAIEYYEYVYNEFTKYYTNMYDDTYDLRICGKHSTFLDIVKLYKQEILKESRYFSSSNVYFITETLSVEDNTYKSRKTNNITFDNLHEGDLYFSNVPLVNYDVYHLLFSKSIIR